MSAEPIILASASPRRRELIASLGVPFEVVTVNVTELDGQTAPQMAPTAVAGENAGRKVEAVSPWYPERWILGADTVVFLEEKLMGKPASLDEARIFLRALSGKTHEVATACALLSPDGGWEICVDKSRVTFHALTEETIERYLAEVNVLDKAGGYALQEDGEWIIESVEGSRHNVIGLPTELLEKVFKRRGLL